MFPPLLLSAAFQCSLAMGRSQASSRPTCPSHGLSCFQSPILLSSVAMPTVSTTKTQEAKQHGCPLWGNDHHPSVARSTASSHLSLTHSFLPEETTHHVITRHPHSSISHSPSCPSLLVSGSHAPLLPALVSLFSKAALYQAFTICQRQKLNSFIHLHNPVNHQVS